MHSLIRAETPLSLSLLHSEWPKSCGILAALSEIGLRCLDKLSGTVTLINPLLPPFLGSNLKRKEFASFLKG